MVRDLCKCYRVPVRDEGLLATFRSLVRRKYREVLAVDDVSFTIETGETVGFIGPNGAGKTTTLKMLAGLLYPTSGEVRVEGFIPWQRQREYLRQISLVMGNRQQLNWENTVHDSFRVLAAIYRLPEERFRCSLRELVEMLEIEPLLPKLLRNLSLGERMKCELAAALLHEPRVCFLDEPTLGLDVTIQMRLRRFLADYNKRNDATMIITSHYMADVTTLCPRVILIDKGRLFYDGDLPGLAAKIAPFKLVRLAVEEGVAEELSQLIPGFGSAVELIEHAGQRFTLRVDKSEAAGVVAQLIAKLPLVDLSVEDPPIEAVIDQVYREGVGA